MAEEQKSIPEVLVELKDLSIAYAKQETVDPLKALGRFVVFGAAGCFLLGIGVVLLTLSGLRAMQTETGTRFTGNWSWVPYTVAVVVLAILIALSVFAITRKRKAKDKEG